MNRRPRALSQSRGEKPDAGHRRRVLVVGVEPYSPELAGIFDYAGKAGWTLAVSQMWTNPGQLLKALGPHLVGLHLHDARALEDHLPPGSGEMDLTALTGYLEDGVPAVIELAPGTSLDQVAAGVNWVRANLSKPADTATPESPPRD